MFSVAARGGGRGVSRVSRKPPPPRPFVIPPWAYAIALVAVTACAYLNTFESPLVLDDITTILANPSIRRLSRLGDVLFPSGEIYSAGRPVLNLSFALNYAVGGTAVAGYHLVNLAIHLGATLLLFGLARRVMEFRAPAGTADPRAAPVACAIAALWALHPLHTSSVTYVSQRAECLMGLFYLFTLYALVRGARTANRTWAVVGTISCALGMATKETMATAPVVAFLFDAVFLSDSWRDAWRQRRAWHLAHAATWLVLVGLAVGSKLGQRAVGFGHGLDSLSYLALESQAICLYVWRSFVPIHLVFDYGPDLPAPDRWAVAGAALGLAGALAASAWALRRRAAGGFFGVAFFLLLAPTSSIIPIAGQPIAENRMYLPLVAIVAGVVGIVVTRWRRPTTWWALATVALLLAGATYARNETFRSTLTLWGDTAAKRPLNERAATLWSEELKRAGRLPEAIAALEAIHQRRPRSAEICNNLAAALFQAGRLPRAIETLREAIRLKPGYAEAHANLGVMFYQSGAFAEALERFASALQLGNINATNHNFAGLCLARLGRLAEAQPHFERAVQLDPSRADARTNLDWIREQRRTP
ncbi:MAG: hypothetical protein RLZZ15_4446 [Verrucomicrobiota bacterium]